MSPEEDELHAANSSELHSSELHTYSSLQGDEGRDRDYTPLRSLAAPSSAHSFPGEAGGSVYEVMGGVSDQPPPPYPAHGHTPTPQTADLTQEEKQRKPRTSATYTNVRPSTSGHTDLKVGASRSAVSQVVE
ncbi:hypothetical protein ACOMHN_062233 [Nucella lapillus]